MCAAAEMPRDLVACLHILTDRSASLFVGTRVSSRRRSTWSSSLRSRVARFHASRSTLPPRGGVARGPRGPTLLGALDLDLPEEIHEAWHASFAGEEDLLLSCKPSFVGVLNAAGIQGPCAGTEELGVFEPLTARDRPRKMAAAPRSPQPRGDCLRVSCSDSG
jgi:hypothetical protein